MPKLSKKEWIGVAAALVFITYTMFGQSITSSFRQATGGDMASVIEGDLTVPAPGNLAVRDLVTGTGAALVPGMTVDAHLVLKLQDGTVIQDSKLVNGGMPVSFTYGVGQFIPPEWESGIAGMKVGGKRILTIPPELGYGPNAVGPIPGNSTLILEVEVVSAQLSQ
jgi:FKBP-type peptidyl-prolyl cis-trans isomerase